MSELPQSLWQKPVCNGTVGNGGRRRFFAHEDEEVVGISLFLMKLCDDISIGEGAVARFL